jgi:ribosomal protein S18 acetylase RimI-like enzyme
VPYVFKNRDPEDSTSFYHRYSDLETHTFQALGFYERIGYKVFGELPELPSGYTKYYSWKNMAQPYEKKVRGQFEGKN